ncbi:peptidase [Bifidobacteriaceae bacterium NR021]|uniref:SpaH/EbpB family LPXTG-anchored major pilin n=1 Tax=Gardnerella swidsinskii TaxID=2792979 RepID=UPI000E679B56|nr:peptidase [Bifidobacteriaceae bacterium NR021]
MNNFTKRCVAAFASLAMAGTLCAAGAVTVSSVAWASKPSVNQGGSQSQGGVAGLGNPSQPVDSGKAPWELGTEASTKTGSITIYKWKDEVEKGKQKKSTPVPGAKFTVKKVTKIDGKDIDLTKYADWVKVANQMDKLNKNTATVTTEAVTGSPKDTDASGVAKFDLGIGLYQVTESNPPKGFSAAESKPFYMTIPRIEKDDKGNVVYNYAPYADPKNKDLSDSVKKTADTSKTVGAGDKISYTISAELDKMKETGSDDLKADAFNGYSVVDLAPANYFTTYDASVVTKVQLGTGEAPVKNDTTLPATDYNVSGPEDFNDTTDHTTRKKITISFTDAGKAALAKAANGNAGNVVKVFVTLEFTLADSTTLGDKTVINKGGLIPSHEGKTPDVVEGKKYKEVKFSKFKIKKVSSTDQSALEGGKFVIFANKADAQACATELNKANGDVANKCGEKSPRSAFGEKASAKDTGLTEEYSVKRDEDFYIVETVAPDGYIRNPDVVTTKATDGDVTYTFQNLPTKDKGFWFNLPKTGAAGVILFALAGACFVGAGFVVYIHRRKKEEEQAKLRA